MFDETITFEAAVARSIRSRAWVKYDPDLDPLRDDPRLQEMLDRVETVNPE